MNPAPTTHTTKRKPRLLWLTIAAVTVLVAGLAVYKLTELATLEKMVAEYSAPPIAVSVVAPKQLQWKPERTVSGFVEAAKSTAVTTDVPGLVVSVSFESSQVVQKGEILARLDDTLEVIRLKGLTSELAVAEADYNRSERLHETRAISKSEWETVRAKRDAMVAQKRELERSIEKKVIRAPFDGVIGLRDVHPGRYLAEGDAITKLVSRSGARLRFSVNAEDLTQLSQGAHVTFSAGKAEGTAKVAAVSPYVRPEVRQVDVEAIIDGDCTLPSGAFVKVQVPLGKTQPLLGVPVTAVKTQGGRPVVFCITSKDGHTVAQARPVQPGSYVGDLRLIQSGLEPGDRIVSMGGFKLKDGDKVQVMESPQPGVSEKPSPAKG